jgi:hypothetical protein
MITTAHNSFLSCTISLSIPTRINLASGTSHDLHLQRIYCIYTLDIIAIFSISIRSKSSRLKIIYCSAALSYVRWRIMCTRSARV